VGLLTGSAVAESLGHTAVGDRLASVVVGEAAVGDRLASVVVGEAAGNDTVDLLTVDSPVCVAGHAEMHVAAAHLTASQCCW
jgi:predicted alpha/beta-hydrolase family hydrolase